VPEIIYRILNIKNIKIKYFYRIYYIIKKKFFLLLMITNTNLLKEKNIFKKQCTLIYT